uniref:Uncharacterized protein n=1 Tax=Arundo donax TaxID=35708 RepID=A0A0A9D7H6_ARUDO
MKYALVRKMVIIHLISACDTCSGAGPSVLPELLSSAGQIPGGRPARRPGHVLSAEGQSRRAEGEADALLRAQGGRAQGVQQGQGRQQHVLGPVLVVVVLAAPEGRQEVTSFEAVQL